MLQKNLAGQGVYLYAFDTIANVAKTGDAANITGHVSKDGAAGAAFGTANPTEIGGGVYWQPLAQAETNGDHLAFYWSSATNGIQIDPLFDFTVTLAASVQAKLASDGMDAVVVETGLNARQALSIMSAEAGGKMDGVGTGTVHFYAAANPATLRITATYDATGRTGVTLAPPA